MFLLSGILFTLYPPKNFVKCFGTNGRYFDVNGKKEPHRGLWGVDGIFSSFIIKGYVDGKDAVLR